MGVTSAPKKIDWSELAEIKLAQLLFLAQKSTSLRRRIPARTPWIASVRMVSAPAMTRLNTKYRRKKYATDVLSFQTPKIFQARGVLGELVICSSTMKRQAKEHGHSVERELEVLLTHGLLHLIGFDHEEGERQAKLMLRWEKKLLKAAFSSRSQGLIHRAG